METNDKAKIEFLKALNKVQGLLEPAKKDSANPHFKSRYASLASVNEAVMGPIAEAGFVLMAGGVQIEGKPYLRTTLYHVGGHSEHFDYPLIEKSDNPQHIASSVTYARRYSICAMFNLSVEDDDGNAATAGATTATNGAANAKPAAVLLDGALKFVPALGSITKRTTAKGSAWDIALPDGRRASTIKEAEGMGATYAMNNRKEVSVVLKQNGNFLNIGKLVLSEPQDAEIEEVPF